MLFELVLLSIVVGGNPVLSFLESISNSLFIILVELLGQLLFVLDLVAHLIDIIVETVLGIDLILEFLILLGELLRVGDHTVNLLLGETSLIVGNGDSLSLASSLLGGAYSENAILIHFEGDLDLRGATGSGRNAVEVELAEVVVVLNEGTFTFEDGDGDSCLLVLVGGEGLALL
jgi:hypothetical protein